MERTIYMFVKVTDLCKYWRHSASRQDFYVVLPLFGECGNNDASGQRTMHMMTSPPV